VGEGVGFPVAVAEVPPQTERALAAGQAAGGARVEPELGR
jgi:hypothetical protein